MKETVRLAFDAASKGYSPDRVIADPELNSNFLLECRTRGLSGTDAELNRALLNLRKRGELRGLKSLRSSFRNDDEYRFASEMAVRFLERREGISLDEIFCDPRLAHEFDGLAEGLAPGYKSVEYRWAALKLRKTRGLKPENANRLIAPQQVLTFRVAELKIDDVPIAPGLYLFFTTAGVLYLGEAENLRNRIRKHIDHSDNKGLAKWLWQSGNETLHLELQVLSKEISRRARRALESELIASRTPLFNVKP